MSYVTLKRGTLDNACFRNEAFCERAAFVWLVENARWADGSINFNGQIVHLKRGQLCHSARFLAEKWGWSKSSVDRFITRLKTGTLIGTAGGTGFNIITICNYDDITNPETDIGTASGTDSGTGAGQERDKEETRNKENNNITPYSPPSLRSGEEAQRKTKIGSRLEIETLPEEWADAAMTEMGWTKPVTLDVWAGFRDYWLRQRGAKARKLNWDATWRNWFRAQNIRPRTSLSASMPGKPLPAKEPPKPRRSSVEIIATERAWKAATGGSSEKFSELWMLGEIPQEFYRYAE